MDGFRRRGAAAVPRLKWAKINPTHDHSTQESPGWAFANGESCKQGLQIRSNVLPLWPRCSVPLSFTDIAMHPFRRSPPTLDRMTFQALADAWRRDTRLLSSVTEMEAHPAYRTIVAAGPTMVPFILEDLEENGSHWFGALNRLTGGAVHVPRVLAGRLRAVKKLWITWGYEQGLLVDREPPPFV